jgi:hypothetical protein
MQDTFRVRRGKPTGGAARGGPDAVRVRVGGPLHLPPARAELGRTLSALYRLC